CGTVADFGLNIEPLIHPVTGVGRDARGQPHASCDDRRSGGSGESVLYVGLERSGAEARRARANVHRSTREHGAAAVRDRQALQGTLREHASSIPDGEGPALLHWFLDRSFTLLAHETLDKQGNRTNRLGVTRMREMPVLSKESQNRAFGWFKAGGQAPLIVKSNQISTVHRHVLMDIIIVPVLEKDTVVGLSMTAGLWTSSALAAPPEEVPVL